MTVPCSCCPVEPEGCYTANPDFDLPLTPAAGGAIVTPGASGGAPMQIHFTNWAGLGWDGDVFVTYTGAVPSFVPVSGINVGLGGRYAFNITFGVPVGLRRLGLTDLDNNAEQLFNFAPALSGVSGAGIVLGGCNGSGAPPPQGPGEGCIRAAGNNRSGFAIWPNVLSSAASWVIGLPGGFGFGFPNITIGLGLQLPVYRCRTPNGVLHWYDSNSNEVAPGLVVPCP